MWQAGEEVIQITSSGGYLDNLLGKLYEFRIFESYCSHIFNQKSEQWTLGSESKCSSTAPSWDLYVKSGDNVVNAKGKANEIGQSWCPADLLYFSYQLQVPVRGHVYTLCKHM